MSNDDIRKRLEALTDSCLIEPGVARLESEFAASAREIMLALLDRIEALERNHAAIESFAEGARLILGMDDRPQLDERVSALERAGSPEPAEQWRLLGPDERLLPGDEWSKDGWKTWFPVAGVHATGPPAMRGTNTAYRRRIQRTPPQGSDAEPQPEAVGPRGIEPVGERRDGTGRLWDDRALIAARQETARAMRERCWYAVASVLGTDPSLRRVSKAIDAIEVE